MQVEIDGHLECVPTCTCGKCVVKRLRKGNFLSYPYNKNIKSMYQDDFGPNNSQIPFNDKKKYFNKAKICNIGQTYTDHIPTSLLSTQKKDFKPFKVSQEENVPTKYELDKAPFLGNTTYKNAYTDWGSTKESKIPTDKLPDIHIPLRGEANYKESYPRYGKKNYENTDLKIIPKPNLTFFGSLNPDTSYGTTFKPVDFKQPQYFNQDGKNNKKGWEKTSFVSANFPPSNFETSYSKSIGNFDTKNICKLREFLVKRGKNSLEV